MPKVTYGRLDEVLRSLEFSVHVAEGRARVYQHEPTGALIYLPAQRLTKTALPHHLATARMAVDLYGIADPMEFTMSLHQTT